MFLIFIEPAVYHERISGKNIIFSAMLLVGVLITVPKFSLENGTTVGIIWGMLSSFAYALLTLCNRNLSASYQGMWVSFREQLVAAIVLLPLMILKHDAIDTVNVVGIIAIGVICTVMGFSLFVSAQRYVSAQSAGISAGMETVYGICAQMKTFIDRTYPIWRSLGNKEVYYIISAGLGENIIERSLGDLDGFIEHLEGSVIKDRIYAAGVTEAGAVANQTIMEKAYQMGNQV
jgi:threonine/homoserine efflux transporter RhtA